MATVQSDCCYRYQQPMSTNRISKCISGATNYPNNYQAVAMQPAASVTLTSASLTHPSSSTKSSSSPSSLILISSSPSSLSAAPTAIQIPTTERTLSVCDKFAFAISTASKKRTECKLSHIPTNANTNRVGGKTTSTPTAFASSIALPAFFQFTAKTTALTLAEKSTRTTTTTTTTKACSTTADLSATTPGLIEHSIATAKAISKSISSITYATYTTINISRAVGWLLSLAYLFSLCGLGHAGFACLSNPCIFGVCIDGLNSSYSCYCIDGYTGVQCQTNWDECWSMPCQNGGTCIDGVAYYNCTCPDGFTGINCEEDVDECLSNPCQNSGHCQDRSNGYLCKCHPGYMGQHCEIDVAVCETDTGTRCYNGAACIEGPGLDFTCQCSPGWKGNFCQDEIDECSSAPCQNGGICVDKLASYACACPTGYTGTNCEEEILLCSDNPCQNNALCLMEGGIPTCYCVPDYHGEKCEYQYDECQMAPRCLNGGTCIDGVDAFSCSCPPRLTGLLCECLLIGNESLDCNYTATTKGHGTPPIDENNNLITTLSTDKKNDISEITEISDLILENISEFSTSKIPSYTTTSPELYYEDSTTAHFTTTKDIDIDSSTPQIDTGQEEPAITESSNQVLHETKSTSKQATNWTYLPPARPTFPESNIINATTQHPCATYQPHLHKTFLITATTKQDDLQFSKPSTVTSFLPSYPEFVVTTKYYNLSHKTETSEKEHSSSTEMFSSSTEATFSSTTELSDEVPSSFFSPSTTLSETELHSDTTYSTQFSPEDFYEISTEFYKKFSPTFTTDSETSSTYEDDHSSIASSFPDWISTASDSESYDSTSSVPTSIETTAPSSPLAILTSAITASSTTFSTPYQPRYPVRPTYPTGRQTPLTSLKSVTVTETYIPIDADHRNKITPTITTSAEEYPALSDCSLVGCYNGGTCVKTSEGSKCVCRFDRQGAFCQKSIVIKNAAFSGDSYISHRIHGDEGTEQHTALNSILPMHVQLKVRTRATNGLIMLAAAQGSRGGHYMALFLQKGLLQFQFSCGLQTMLLSELETLVNNGHEIQIRAELDFSRNWTHCNASLMVNNTLAMSGDQPTWLKQMPILQHSPDVIMSTWLHLGGAPQAPIGLAIELPPTQNGIGFTGCLHSLYINEQAREIFGEAVDGFGVTECGSLACLSSPCRNGAACIKIDVKAVNKNGDNVEMWKCKCPTGYMGITCEISVCENNPCQYGGTCATFPGSGYLCLCPLGKHGHYCEHNVEVALPSFSGSVNGLSSFVAYTVPIPLEYSMELSFKILPQTMSQISLLAFLGQGDYHDERSDHLAVSFIQGYIMLTWNLGSAPRRIFTQKPIEFRTDTPRIPYEIKVGRVGRHAWLSVDGKFNVSGRSSGSVRHLDVLPILYLGGHEAINFHTLPHDLPLHSGFQGCIYDLNLRAGQVSVPLQETRGIRGRGVGQCGTRECHRHACQHDGACLQHGATFTCICQEGWYGPLCAQSMNPCDSLNNRCAADSTCVPLVNGYECDCPVGKMGKNCFEEIHSLSDISLTGRRSYMALKWPQLIENNNKPGSRQIQYTTYPNYRKTTMELKGSNVSNQHFVMKLLNEVEAQHPAPLPMRPYHESHRQLHFFLIEFQLRPLSERGLLIYIGMLNQNQGKQFGFVSLSLQGGVVEFRISNSNNHITVVRSVRVLAIGEWHKIKMSQRGRRLTLWVEGTSSTAYASLGEVLIDQEHLLYIGGLKDLSKLPYNAISGFPIPFRGCIRGLVINGIRLILNETTITESRNIRDCDGTACGGDSCEANGHCWLDDKLQPHCKCHEYTKGPRCEFIESCKLIPCQNNGQCLETGRCSCPNGWMGFYCEIAVGKHNIPSFRGNSYLMVSAPRIPVKDKRNGPSLYIRSREALEIALNFSTIETNGLLLWSERGPTKFLGLGIENGHLKLASNLLGSDDGIVSAPANGLITDGNWHTTRLQFDGNHMTLYLDDELIFNEKLLSLNENLNALKDRNQTETSEVSASSTRREIIRSPTVTYQDIFYLGGFPNSELVSRRTQGRFQLAFNGCLQHLQFGNSLESRIENFSPFDGANIEACDIHGFEPTIMIV